jgi:hypothetical protein
VAVINKIKYITNEVVFSFESILELHKGGRGYSSSEGRRLASNI